jgi:hypothetical protein
MMLCGQGKNILTKEDSQSTLFYHFHRHGCAENAMLPRCQELLRMGMKML